MATVKTDLKDLMTKFQELAKENLMLWSSILGLLIVSFYMEKIATPAKKPFSLSDPTIAYPFTENERYSENMLFIVCLLFPLLIITMLIVIDDIGSKFQRFYKSTSCFSFAIALSAFMTSFLKIRIAKLRPDFLARCDPTNIGELSNNVLLYDESICSAPLGQFILNDGYKSCPSGHSSMSMCGMLFLSIWLYLTYGKTCQRGLLKLMCFIPLLLSFDVITSRIYDFRHGYFDVMFGTFVGIVCTLLSIINIELTIADMNAEVILPL